MRSWLARRAALTANPAAGGDPAAVAGARQQQREALRTAMNVPGAIELPERMQPGATSGGPAPLAPPVAPPTPAPPAPYTNFGGMTTDDYFNNYAVTADRNDPRMQEEARSFIALQNNPANAQAMAQRQQQDNAYQIARDASLGMMMPGSYGADGTDYGRAVADPSAALNAFINSGYTGQQALADGWATGVGAPGWQTASPSQGGAGGSPAPAVPPPAATPPVATVTAPSGPSPTASAPPLPPTASASLASAIRQANAPAVPPKAPAATFPTTSQRPMPGAPVAPTPTASPTPMPTPTPTPNTLAPRKSGTTYRVGLG